MDAFEQWWSANYPSKPSQSAQTLATLAFAKEAAWKSYQASQPKWQPIETAPKDGVRILVWCFEEVYIAAWSNDYHCFSCCEFTLDAATHWMPIFDMPTK